MTVGTAGDRVDRASRHRWHAAVLGLEPALRPLPWRAVRSAWPVLVSEVMLQQTQVSRVVEPWQSFTARFPDPATCARQPVGAVVQAWAGLGYNRRAVHLHATACAVVDRHAGQVPAVLEDLLALPGLGPYTARAVLAFAYERDVAVVDTNVRRVLTRALLGHPAPARRLQALADSLVPEGRGWAWNQCLVELGARYCTARSPACGSCPLARGCRWSTDGRVTPDPAAPTSRPTPFAGSDRQGRGRLVDALRRGPVGAADLASVAGWPTAPQRARAVADRLVAEGLAVSDGQGGLRLAG